MTGDADPRTMLARDPAAPSYLVATDIDGIQSYLFQSVRLNTIAGASNIIADADRLLGEVAEQTQGRVVLASGGIGLVEFADRDLAATFASTVADQFRRTSVSGRLTASQPIERSAAESFGAAAGRSFRNVETRKRAGHAADQPVTIPYGEPCEACGQELATNRIAFEQAGGQDSRLLGPACHAKFDHHRDHRHFWLPWVRSSTNASFQAWRDLDPRRRLAREFNELTGDGDLGLVLADADGTGRLLRDLADQDRSQWSTFSGGLAELSRTSLVCAIDDAIPTALLLDVDGGPLPVLPLFCGGDDFVLACRGDLALKLADRLCREFAEADKPWCPGNKLSLSSAVVVTRPGFPFRIAHQIASRLLREAKRHAKEAGWRDQGVGAIDYALITEASADADSLLADRVLESRSGKDVLHLSGRPYRVGVDGPGSLLGLRTAVERARALPRNKLFELRRLFSAAAWLRAEQSDSTDAKKIAEWRRELDRAVEQWNDRLMRQGELWSIWTDVARTLGVKFAGDRPTAWLDDTRTGDVARPIATTDAQPADRHVWRSPWGDLADGMRLFGES